MSIPVGVKPRRVPFQCLVTHLMRAKTNWVVPAVPDTGAHGSKPKPMRTNTFQAGWQVAFIAMDWLSIHRTE